MVSRDARGVRIEFRSPEAVARRNTNRVIRRRKESMAKYGLTIEEYEWMLEGQDGRCALCGNDNGTQRLHVDHDHVTGEVRQLLCASCNIGLGYFKDDSALMRKAAVYMEFYGE